MDVNDNEYSYKHHIPPRISFGENKHILLPLLIPTKNILFWQLNQYRPSPNNEGEQKQRLQVEQYTAHIH